MHYDVNNTPTLDGSFFVSLTYECKINCVSKCKTQYVDIDLCRDIYVLIKEAFKQVFLIPKLQLNSTKFTNFRPKMEEFAHFMPHIH